MGAIYFVAMLAGAFGYRVPPVDWTMPVSPRRASRTLTKELPPPKPVMITTRHVHVDKAWRTPQFWFLWAVLCLNVSAGIGVIGMASPMIQEVFGGELIDLPRIALRDLSEVQKGQLATIGAAFAALLSVFNIAGRISWASLSDYIGRKRTYFIFFALGAVLYTLAPLAGQIGSVPLFVLIFCIILTMYGGGFATIPAYLADMFGTQFVGAIHGRLLTAWSAAGILGPVLVNYIREYQIDRGIPAAQAYNVTMYVLAGLLVIGFFCNLAVRPVADRWYMTEAELESERALLHGAAKSA
jgi:MFS family permease